MSNSEDICSVHKEIFSFVCIAPVCGLFKPLCTKCVKEHLQTHGKQEEPYPDSLSFQETKAQLTSVIERAHKSLEAMIDKAYSVLTHKSQPTLNIFQELDEIRNNVNDNFDELISDIRQAHEEKVRRIDSEMMKLYEDLRQSHEFCAKLLKSQMTSELMKKIFILDLNYQVNYKRQRIEQLLEQRENVQFEAYITKEYKMKFYATFNDNLRNLVHYEGELKGQEPSQKKKSFMLLVKDDPYEITREDSYTDDNNNKLLLHYFEPGTKNFYYIDVSKVGKFKSSFEKIVLNINFDIYKNSRSIVGDDGNVYFLGGYPEKINEKNEDHFKTIYQLDLAKKTLFPRDKMVTLRHSFGICTTKGAIYITGGVNYREGALIKCEKFMISRNTCVPLNFLNIKSLGHSLSNFKNKFLFKFGGLRYDFKDKRELSLDLFERYDIDNDIWEKIKVKDTAQNTPLITWLSGSCWINESNILVFGGKGEKSENVKQTYALNMSQTSMHNSNEYNISLIETSSKAIPYTAYFSSNPIISGRSVFCIGHLNDEDRKIFVFDSKSWKTY